MVKNLGKEKGRAFSRFDIIAFLFLLAAFCFLLWKAPYGYVHADESFYLSIPYRLLQGDALVCHEWNLAQLFSFLLYPAVKLYVLAAGSTEGIFLFFRYFYVFAQLIAAVYIYCCLKHIQPLGALFAALGLMCYAPLNIMAMSYNTLALMLMSGACVTMARSKGGGAFPAGLMFAGAVLCCPYLALVYVLYSLACLAQRLILKTELEALRGGFWLRFSGGCALLAVLFGAFVLSRASLSDIIASIPLIFTDTEHPNYPIYYRLFKYAESIYGNFWFNAFSLSWPVLALIMAVDKKRMHHRCLYIIPAMLITAAYFAYYVFEDRTVNYLMFPMNILGAFSFFLLRKKPWRSFFFIYVPGILYSLCIHFASNLGLMSIASALSISGIASALYICLLAKELAEGRGLSFDRVLAAGLVVALLMQLAVLCWFRSRYTMWDLDVPQLSATLSSGPQKGVVTTEERAQDYNELIENTAELRNAGLGSVLYLDSNTWLYLMDDASMGSFSAWISQLHPRKDMERLQNYWQLYPEKIPEMAFVMDDEELLQVVLEALPGEWLVEHTSSGYILKK